MSDRTSPNAEECEAAKAKAAYEAWLRNKVAASVSDTRPSITHSEMEHRMQQRIQRLKASKAGSPDPAQKIAQLRAISNVKRKQRRI